MAERGDRSENDRDIRNLWERLNALENHLEELTARPYRGPYPRRYLDHLIEEIEDLRFRIRRMEEGGGGPPNESPSKGAGRDDGGEDRTSERRWTDHRVNQVGATNNMLIALSGATVAFVAAFGDLSVPTSDPSFDPASSWVTWGGLAMAVVSAIVGVALAIVRVQNFRITAKVARLQRLLSIGKDKTIGREDVTSKSSKRACMDNWTYWLLYTQVATWILSALAITIGNLLLLL